MEYKASKFNLEKYMA